MTKSNRWRFAGAAAAAILALSPLLGAIAQNPAMTEIEPAAGKDVTPFLVAPGREPHLSTAEEVRLLRQHVKYVFVLFQENRSYDSYFASFPGGRGLFAGPTSAVPGFTQPIINVDGSMGSVSPFRIGPDQFAADTDDVDHSFARMRDKMDIQDGKAAMDHFALIEEKKYTTAGANPSLKAKQYGELAMAYADCDTVPFLWNYANRFTLFDNFYQLTIGPSAPGAISLIAAQTGETQWVRHPDQANSNPALAKNQQGEPVVSDARPYWGSPDDKSSPVVPRNPNDKYFPPQINQTFASLPLSLGGRDATTIAKSDKQAASDLADVKDDLPAVAKHGARSYAWGWYQEGYGTEPDSAGGDSHTAYVTHHNGPAFFGYVSNNPKQAANMHGLSQFFDDIKAGKLASSGGLYYLRGGYANIAGLKPADPDPAVQKAFRGDDDHPAYSDAQISEALVAAEVNAIARSKYWKDSAILITYDESEGDYDHVAPRIIASGPDKGAVENGPRIPLLVISPYARAHTISHEEGTQASVVKLVDAVFGLPPLADLPNELKARIDGKKAFGQDDLGPADDKTPGVGQLLSAFDPARLAGKAKPLPPEYAEIPDEVVTAMPPYGNKGCAALGIVPTDIAQNLPNPIPADFNPRPNTNPTPVPPPPAPAPAAMPATPAPASK